MRATITSALVAAMVGGGAAITAAPGQTPRPGDMTRADVWVRNEEAHPIPVRVRQARDEAPIRVVVANGESTGTPPVAVRTATTWSYRTITIKTADDPAAVLANPGVEGWEVTGVTWPAPDGTKLLLKRPR